MPKVNPNDTVWLAARGANNRIRKGRCVNAWPHTEDEWLYLIETENGSQNVYSAGSIYLTPEEAEESFARAVEESRQRAEAMPPIECEPPIVGHELLDALISAAWEHGHQVAAADEGYGSYPGKAERDEIRRLARAVLREVGVL